MKMIIYYINRMITNQMYIKTRKNAGRILFEMVLISFSIFLGMKADEKVSENINNKNVKIIQLTFLNALKEDLNDSMLDLNRDLQGHIQIMEESVKIHKWIYAESRDFRFIKWEALITDFQFYPNTSAYESFKYSGFEIIPDISLRTAIVRLYELDFNRLEKMGKEYSKANDIKKYMDDYLSKNFKLSSENQSKNVNLENKLYTLSFCDSNLNVKIFRIIPKNYTKLYKDEEFKYLLQKSMLIRKDKIAYYETIKNHIISVDDKIDLQISKIKETI